MTALDWPSARRRRLIAGAVGYALGALSVIVILLLQQ